MDENYENELESLVFGKKINIVVQTCNYKKGEEVTIIVNYSYDIEGEEIKTGIEHKFIGIVGKKGIAKIENIILKKISDEEFIIEKK
ncbi:hypothetical protein [Apibacter muscae]|uniref:hypothetical protein n=1 Tax=Apibacter muscae TaxID=2509004 RepID=UPI0011B3E5F6|nr:hypothetical protein [Apibacter muscae]